MFGVQKRSCAVNFGKKLWWGEKGVQGGRSLANQSSSNTGPRTVNGAPSRRRTGIFVWPLLAVVIALNLWYDYYHPLGIMADVVIVIVLCIRWWR